MPADAFFLQQVLPEIDRLLTGIDVPDAPPYNVENPPGVLVALSGGPDSVALLLAAIERRRRGGGPVEALHLNHLLRGKDSDGDEAFCVDLCRRLDVPLHLRRTDPRPLARDRGLGLEEAARHLRHAFIAETLDARPELRACATGHHRDDQLETLIMRFFRGAGADGMLGIRPTAGRIIHPLLPVGRDAILSFLEEHGQDSRHDPTNEDGSNLRGRVRHELLPALRDLFGEAAVTAPLRLAELLAADTTGLEDMARTVLADWSDGGVDSSLPVAALAELPRPVSSRVVRLHLREACGCEEDLAQNHLERLLDWLPDSVSGNCVDLVGGWRACRDFDRLDFLSPDAVSGLSPADSMRILVRPSTPREAAETAPEPRRLRPGPEGWRLTLPADALRGEPRLRPWRDGDRMVPFGMSGRKKISDLLRELRVPARDRSGVLLIEDDEGPLWLVGLVRAERTRILPSTTAAVTLHVRESGDSPEA